MAASFSYFYVLYADKRATNGSVRYVRCENPHVRHSDLHAGRATQEGTLPFRLKSLLLSPSGKDDTESNCGRIGNLYVSLRKHQWLWESFIR